MAVDPAVVARARDIIAGRDPGPALPDQSRLRARLDREFGHRVPPPTPEAIAYQLNQNAIVEYGGGRLLLVYVAPDGLMTPLAAGDEEPFAVYHALPAADRAKTCITDSLGPQWGPARGAT